MRGESGWGAAPHLTTVTFSATFIWRDEDRHGSLSPLVGEMPGRQRGVCRRRLLDGSTPKPSPSNRLRRSNHLVDRHWRKTTGVDADIEPIAFELDRSVRQVRIVEFFRMGMAMQVDRAAPAAVPVLDRIVEENEPCVGRLDLMIVADVCDGVVGAFELGSVVMIADEHEFFGVEALHPRRRGFPGDIAEMIDTVARLDPRVPALDERFVHFPDIRKRPVGQFDDIGVAEMGAAGEEDLHWFFSRMAVERLRRSFDAPFVLQDISPQGQGRRREPRVLMTNGIGLNVPF